MSTPYQSVEIVVETRSTTEALVTAFLPGKIRTSSFAPNGEVLGNDSGDTTITRIRYEESTQSKLIVYPAPSDAQSADARIRQLCAKLNNLPEEARREWDQAELREFYVGYDVDGIEFSYANQFSEDTISAAAALRATIGIVMYKGRSD
jgi:hypothetical protein